MEEYTFTTADKISIATSIAVVGIWAYAVIQTRKETKAIEKQIADFEAFNNRLAEDFNLIIHP